MKREGRRRKGERSGRAIGECAGSSERNGPMFHTQSPATLWRGAQFVLLPPHLSPHSLAPPYFSLRISSPETHSSSRLSEPLPFLQVLRYFFLPRGSPPRSFCPGSRQQHSRIQTDHFPAKQFSLVLSRNLPTPILN